MTDRTDADLLEQFARNESETAFAALVERYIGLVHSVALRHTANPQHAQDITQAVFIILARKSRSFGHKTVLSGWLYQTARLTAANFRRSEQRRIRREQEAFMQCSLEETASDEVWPELSPLLDDAMGSLGATDRDAIVLRYFQNKTLPEVGVALGMEERAAQKRVSRALEKLRNIFTKRGVALTTTIIAGAVSANSVQAAPVGLAATIAVTAAKGSVVTASTLTLVKGALKVMAWTKVKIAMVAGAAIILATGTTTMVVRKITAPSASDLSWADDPKYWELDFGDPDPQKALKTADARSAAFKERIDKLPPVLILRPTQFSSNLGSIGDHERFLGRGRSLVDLIRHAYDPELTTLTIRPANFPKEKFDLMLTLPNKPREALQEEIKSRFGFVAHRETIETNVLILRVKNSAAPALQATKGGMPSYPTRSSQNRIAIKNQQLSGVAACFSALLKMRVVNQTEIKGRYDIALQWQSRAGESDEDALKRTVLDQLGLEFVPGRESIKYLVVEKVE